MPQSDLTERQLRAVPLYISSRNLQEACDVIGVKPATLRLWLRKGHPFRSAVDEQLNAVSAHIADRMKDAAVIALDALTEIAMDGGTETARVNAAGKLLDAATKHKDVQEATNAAQRERRKAFWGRFTGPGAPGDDD